MLLTAKTLITGDGKTVLKDHSILVENNIIRDLGPASTMLEKYSREELIDYGDATICPGLIDMHIHLGHSWMYQADAMYFDEHLIAYYALQNAQKALTVGVTTVRDVGSERLVCEKLRYAGKKGWFDMPRIIHCGTGLSMTNGHMDIINYYTHNRYTKPEWGRTVDGVWDMRKAVREQIQEGADWIKLCASHRTNVPEFTMEELEAGVDEAHRVNKKCAVHAGLNPGLDMSINAGVDTIEHGTFLSLEQAEKMKKNGQVWVPTIMAYTFAYEKTKEEFERTGGKISDPVLAANMGRFKYFEDAAFAYRDNFKAIYDMGVTVVAGTDVVINGAPPSPVAQEISYMVRYGLTPVQAIQTATQTAAQVLGMEDTIGLLAAGLAADILVCEGDASEDIIKLQSVKEVYANGKSVYKK